MTTEFRCSVLELAQFTHYDGRMKAPGEAPDVSVILKEQGDSYSSQGIVENDLVLHIKRLKVLIDLRLFL